MFPFYTFIHMTGMGPPKTGVSLYCVMRMNFTNLSKGEKFKIIYAVICFFYFFFSFVSCLTKSVSTSYP